MKNEPFAIFLTVLLVEKNIQGISLKSGRNAYFLSVLLVKKKIFSAFSKIMSQTPFFVPFNNEEKIFLQKADHLALNCML